MVFYSWGDLPTDELFIAQNSTDWDELSVTWNNKPLYGLFYSITAPSVLYDWWEIDVTDWVQGVVEGTYSNYGFQLFQSDTDYAGFSMRTKEGVSSPELVLDYTPSDLQSATFGGIKALFNLY